jgi:hypothetical protein
VHDQKPEIFFERIKIVVAVQQGISGFQAESRNQTVDRFADGMATTSKRAVILGCRDSQIRAASVKYAEFRKLMPYLNESCIPANALQYFAQAEVSQPETLMVHFTIKPGCVAIRGASEIVDPHCCIHDDHNSLFFNATKPRFVEVAFPPYLAPQPAYRSLGMGLN